jgi:7-keto-8-aminopelargonate synthetase-like enzyme
VRRRPPSNGFDHYTRQNAESQAKIGLGMVSNLSAVGWISDATGEENTLRAGKWLFDHGFYVQSVLFPAVGLNQGVLRIQVNANHAVEAIDGLLDALAHLQKEIRFPQVRS